MVDTYIFGNGLSMACNPSHYSLPNLTAEVLDRISKIGTADGVSLGDHIAEIVDALTSDATLDHLGDIETFEQIAGPLERLTTSIQHVGALAAIGSDQSTRDAILELGLQATRLYNQVVGVVLELVTQHTPALGYELSVPTVAKHLVGVAKKQKDLDVFVLNYDALLDSALLSIHEEKNHGFQLTDEFDGRKWKTVAFRNSSIKAIGMRDVQYHAYPRLRLFHLHGAATWLRDDEGIYKAQHLQDLRHAGVFADWAKTGYPNVSPVLVLGDRKDRLVAKAPFDDQYAELRSSVAQADRVVLAGYGFGDVPLNAAVRASLSEAAEVVVINPDESVAKMADRAFPLQKAQKLTFIHAGLPDGLDQL